MSINQHIHARFGLACETAASIDANETISNILTRRSHRAFTQDPISADMLDTLFATAFSAASKSDLQQACVIHVKDKSKQRRIADLSPSTRWIAEAPVFLVWCGDSRRILQDLRRLEGRSIEWRYGAQLGGGFCIVYLIRYGDSRKYCL